MVTTERHRVVIVGAGIVGASCAVHLRHDGHDVTLIDRLPPGEACSFGNAGMLECSSSTPLSMPGVFRQVPKWLLDPLGPFTFSVPHVPRLIPFLFHFIRAGRRDRVERIADALASLIGTTVEDHQRQAAWAGAASLIKVHDHLCVYESDAAFRADAYHWEVRRQRWPRLEVVDGAAIRALEPTVAPMYPVGVLLRDHGYTVDPGGLVKALAEHVAGAGGRVLRGEVRAIEAGGGRVRVVTDAGALEADAVVIAAGAWSTRLTARLGYPVPLVAERGYHVTLRHAGVSLNAPLIVGDYKFAVTPMAMGLRFAGTAEFAALDSPPNYARARMLLRHAARMFPGIPLDDYTEWMGQRPTLPDSLPVIGPAPRHPGVYFAFGHHHLGLTAGPKTGQLIADLIAGRAPIVDLRPFRVDRFS
jgi:D-amino-acid dehydrogenase